MADFDQSAFDYEQQQLKKHAAEIHRQLERLEAAEKYTGSDITEQSLEDVREKGRQSLRVANHEPYFGRLDFQEDGTDAPLPLYIGKAGVSEESGRDVMIVDWRAPVASLFYSFTGGEETAFYDSPEGLIEGNIHLKRNIVVRSQELLRVVDTYEKGKENHGAADEFLLYRLGERKDSKLRDIVSTIQAEQNDIIRSKRDAALIIQGVAGSGKTTVALHRLAYLIYEYRENMEAERMIIFAPNAMFLDYISNVLPELGVGNIQQTTFTDWAKRMLESKVKILQETAKTEEWFAPGPQRSGAKRLRTGRLKGSLSYMNLVSRLMEELLAKSVPDKDFEAWENTVLKQETIAEWYHSDTKSTASRKRERVQEKIKRWLDHELAKIWEQKVQKETKKKANQRLRAYMNSWPSLDPLALYKEILSAEEMRAYLPDELYRATLKSAGKKTVLEEDLAALLHIQLLVKGIDRDAKFQHCVIDEAQDFSPYQIALLNQLSVRGSFTILGDLSQGIYDDKGLESWEELHPIFEKEHLAYFELEKSYRSTMEIIEFANGVLTSAYQPAVLASPVFRSADDVRVEETAEGEETEKLIEALSELSEQNANTIGIIGRTEEHCERIHRELAERGQHASILSGGKRDYGGGISVIPIHLAKGLEFDAVLICDANKEHYEKTPWDAKLLYVGCTRALHFLRIYYSGDPSPLLPV